MPIHVILADDHQIVRQGLKLVSRRTVSTYWVRPPTGSKRFA